MCFGQNSGGTSRYFSSEPFGYDIVPSVTAKLFRVLAAFGPAYIVQVSRQDSEAFGLAWSA